VGKRIVIKVGSSTLAAEGGGIDRAWAGDFVRQVCELRDEGFEPIIVSSGAMAAGFPKLGFAERPVDLPSLQACAAAGQI
jgi:glutamate 5-kinase